MCNPRPECHHNVEIVSLPTFLNHLWIKHASQSCPVGSGDDVEEGDGVEQDLRNAEHDNPEEMSGEETSKVDKFSKYSFQNEYV